MVSPERAGYGTNDVTLTVTQNGGERCVTNWDHVDPGLRLTIEEGWWIADTQPALILGPLTERGVQTYDPLVMIVELQGM